MSQDHATKRWHVFCQKSYTPLRLVLQSLLVHRGHLGFPRKEKKKWLHMILRNDIKHKGTRIHVEYKGIKILKIFTCGPAGP